MPWPGRSDEKMGAGLQGRLGAGEEEATGIWKQEITTESERWMNICFEQYFSTLTPLTSQARQVFAVGCGEDAAPCTAGG